MRLISNSIHSMQAFTLVELLVVQSLIIFMLVLAVPVTSEITSSYNRQLARTQFEADLLSARRRAFNMSAKSVVTIDAASETYSLGVDYLPFNSAGGHDSVDYLRSPGSGITLSPTQELIFDSRGLLVDDAGELVSRQVVFSQDGLAFATATVYPIGSVSFD